jgi:hypothetical protein
VHDGIEDNNDADTVHLYRTADYDESDVSNWVESDDTDSEDTDLGGHWLGGHRLGGYRYGHWIKEQ